MLTTKTLYAASALALTVTAANASELRDAAVSRALQLRESAAAPSLRIGAVVSPAAERPHLLRIGAGSGLTDESPAPTAPSPGKIVVPPTPSAPAAKAPPPHDGIIDSSPDGILIEI